MHPKNTTGSVPAQHQLLTAATDFITLPGESPSPFAVKSGVPLGDALNLAFSLLAAVKHIATDSIDRDPVVNDIVAISLLADASQALVLSCLPAIEQGGVQ